MEQTNLRMKFKKMKTKLIAERGKLDGAKHLEKEKQRLIEKGREPKGRQTKTEKDRLL